MAWFDALPLDELAAKGKTVLRHEGRQILHAACAWHAGRHRLRRTVRQGRPRSGGRVAGGVAKPPDAPAGMLVVVSQQIGRQLVVAGVKVGLDYVPESGDPAFADLAPPPWVPACAGMTKEPLTGGSGGGRCQALG